MVDLVCIGEFVGWKKFSARRTELSLSWAKGATPSVYCCDRNRLYSYADLAKDSESLGLRGGLD